MPGTSTWKGIRAKIKLTPEREAEIANERENIRAIIAVHRRRDRPTDRP